MTNLLDILPKTAIKVIVTSTRQKDGKTGWLGQQAGYSNVHSGMFKGKVAVHDADEHSRMDKSQIRKLVLNTENGLQSMPFTLLTKDTKKADVKNIGLCFVDTNGGTSPEKIAEMASGENTIVIVIINAHDYEAGFGHLAMLAEITDVIGLVTEGNKPYEGLGNVLHWSSIIRPTEMITIENGDIRTPIPFTNHPVLDKLTGRGLAAGQWREEISAQEALISNLKLINQALEVELQGAFR